MQNVDSQLVVVRFFEVLEYLKANKHIRGLQTFTTKYNINKRNLYQLKADPSRDIFQVSWLTFLVNDYNVSARYLLTGTGPILVNRV